MKIVNENQNDLTTACAFLTHEANERGGEDNITVILARLSGSDMPEASEEAIKIEMLDLPEEMRVIRRDDIHQKCQLLSPCRALQQPAIVGIRGKVQLPQPLCHARRDERLLVRS